MKTKLIYLALTCISIVCGVSNAMDKFNQLAITDGKQSSNQLTPYQSTSAVSSYQGGGQAITNDKVDFTNASQQKVQLTFKYPSGDNIQIDGMVRYVGQNMYGLPHFIEYLNGCLAQYKPGMNLNTTKEIVITGEDSIALSAFAKYLPNNLFYTWIKTDDIRLLTPEFKKFKDSKDRPFGFYNYDDNCIMFSMMYYPGTVEIENTYYKYNNLKFSFTPCPEEQKTAGKKVEDFTLKSSDITYQSSARLHSDTKDTLAVNCGSFSAIYQYAVFKMEDGLYRLNVKLSTNDSNSLLGLSVNYEDRKITNFLLRIK